MECPLSVYGYMYVFKLTSIASQESMHIHAVCTAQVNIDMCGQYMVWSVVQWHNRLAAQAPPTRLGSGLEWRVSGTQEVV